MIRLTLARAAVLVAMISCIPVHAAKSPDPDVISKDPAKPVHATESPDPDDVCKNPAKYARTIAVFDHLKGRLLTPTPTVLELRDDEVFAVVFCETYPSAFNYEISSIEPEKESKTAFQSGTGRVQITEDDLTSTSVSWKHRETFSLYKVSVTLRKGSTKPEIDGTARQARVKESLEKIPKADMQSMASEFDLEGKTTSEQIEQFLDKVPEVERNRALAARGVEVPEPVYLYTYTFPVWVKTVSWKLTFSTGVAFSDLTNDKFYIETNDQGTPATDDDTKLVRRDSADTSASRPDLVFFSNLRTPDAGKWRRSKLGGHAGLAFGLGLNGNGDPRYFFGPSLTIGRNHNFVLIAGWTGGQVDRLPSGQNVDAPPINDNVLNNLDSSFEHGGFIGLTFSFGERSEKDFISALNGKSGAPEKQDGGGSGN